MCFCGVLGKNSDAVLWPGWCTALCELWLVKTKNKKQQRCSASKTDADDEEDFVFSAVLRWQQTGNEEAKPRMKKTPVH